MDKQKLQGYFLFIIFLIASVFAFLIFKPFLLTVILAIIFAVLFEPIHKRIVKMTHGWEKLSVLLTILIVLVFIFTPLTFLGIQIFHEAGQVYSFLSNDSNGVYNVLNKIQNLLPISQQVSLDFNSYIKQGLEWLVQNIGFIFSNIAHILLNAFIFIFSLYYFLKDGRKIKEIIIKVSPLMEGENQTVFDKLKIAINSVVKGTLFVALIQGILTSVGFAIFGVPNPILWGTMAVIAALIPTVGTSLVIIPGVLFLFVSGPILPAIGLLIWGVVAVGLIDNFLGPKLIERGIKLNPLIILLSVLGSLALFGPIGFLIGPLIISFLFTLIEIYFSRR